MPELMDKEITEYSKVGVELFCVYPLQHLQQYTVEDSRAVLRSPTHLLFAGAKDDVKKSIRNGNRSTIVA